MHEQAPIETNQTLILSDLKNPFPPNDIEWRIGRCGKKSDGSIWAKALAYITARAIHDRLDDVCSPANWQLEYAEHLGETVCRIGIRCGDSWVWKSGGAGKTDFEAYKGGLSSAEKRAGVPWGIGRYLYNLDETWVETSTDKKNGWNYQPASQKKGIPQFYWKTPALPNWALPENKKPNEESEKLNPDTDLKNCKSADDVTNLWKNKWNSLTSEAHPQYSKIVGMFSVRKDELEAV